MRLLVEVKPVGHDPYDLGLSGFVLGGLCHDVSKRAVLSGKFWSLGTEREGPVSSSVFHDR